MMNYNYFIHPDDATALKILKDVPGLSTLMEKVFEYGYEEIMWSNNVTSNLRLSETQMPEIYNRLLSICKTLCIPVPELYIQMSPVPNAWTSGNKRTYITLTFGLIRRFKEEELDAVIAHECGHILCQHIIYSTLANILFELGDNLMDSFLGSIGNVAMKPIKQALLGWSRASELSADRVACMITSAETVGRVMAKLDGIPPVLLKDFNLQTWAKQGEDYEKLKNGNAWNKIVRYMANTDLDHPYGPVRAYEVLRWSKTQQFTRLKSNINLLQSGNACPCCGNPINSEWIYCKNCGAKLR